MAKGHLKEKAIENQILSWLKWSGVMAWKVKSVGTYDVKLGRFRKAASNYRIGVSDILGIYKGKPLAIEVKSAAGRLSPAQEAFLEEFRENGGIGLMVKSVEQLELELKVHDVKEFDKEKK